MNEECITGIGKVGLSNIICCPICNNELTKKNNYCLCKNGHCFDYAKEGYVNLLPPNKKKSKNPGDNKEMIVARRDFLNAGAYKLLLDKLLYKIQKYRNGDIIIEAGCGEGYYISNIQTAITEGIYYGFDISKDAIKLATKRNKNVNYYISSSYSSNIKDKSVDVLIVVFAPFVEEEFNRILKDNGICIVVKPCDKHLIELKEQLYDTIKPAPIDKYKIFKVIDAENLNYKFEASAEDLLNLFKMTPFFYRTNDLKRQNLFKNCLNKQISADFLIQVIKK